jgi:hypothetical protein
MRHFHPLLLSLLLLLPTLPAKAQTGTAISVRYRSAETIYLDAGKAAGVDVGDRLEVLRGGKVIAEIEVVYAANASASARVLSEREPIQPGDRVRILGDTSPPPVEPARPEPPAAEPSSPRTVPREQTAGGFGLFRPSRTRVTGALTFDWESWMDGGNAERDADRTTARLNLRVRDIAGTPLQLRLRMRSREVSRSRILSDGRGGTGGIPASESRDRLYEAALIWNPPDSWLDVRVGRLGTSPFVGLGYVDGAVAAFKVTDWLAVGGVFGRRPEIEELGFASSGSKTGAFVRLTPSGRDADRGLDLLLAGLREEGDLGVSREYVTLETQYHGGDRWSFFQHAEVDLNTDWRELAARDEAQLSALSLTALRRLASGNRLAVSFDRFQPYLTEEDRLSPVDVFDSFYRQGLRVSWQTGRTGGLNLSVDAGLRTREETVIDPRFGISEARETYSLGLGVHHPRLPGLGIFAGANVLGYSSSFADGVVVQTRAGRRLGAGHELSLALGGNLYRTPFEENHTLAWGRASLWLELPLDLFGQAEFELLTGDDDVEGQRLRVGLGYRF